MDFVDPLGESEEHDIVENKVIIDHIEKQSMDSDDEQVVDHLSPQTLLDTPSDNDVQYSVRGPEGLITYRVLQVEDGAVDPNVQQIVTSGPTFANPAVPSAVLTSNINGQLYVISNGNEVFNNQTNSRTLAPRASIIETNNSLVTNIKKKDDRRRATHNEVERRRRDKINNWITRLSKMIPEPNPGDLKGNGHYDGQSKGCILAKACEYIQETQDKLDMYTKDNKILSETVEALKQKNFALERENKEIREMLKRSGIDLPNNDVPS